MSPPGEVVDKAKFVTVTDIVNIAHSWLLPSLKSEQTHSVVYQTVVLHERYIAQRAKIQNKNVWEFYGLIWWDKSKSWSAIFIGKERLSIRNKKHKANDGKEREITQYWGRLQKILIISRTSGHFAEKENIKIYWKWSNKWNRNNMFLKKSNNHYWYYR